MPEPEVTEFTELDVDELHLVARGANGFPPLVAKAADTVECDLCGGSGKIREGHVSCPDCDGSGEVAVEKAALDAKAQAALDDSDFAYVDSDGDRHLPIPDAAHVRAALARFGQTQFDNAADKKTAAKKILAAAKKFDIDVSEDTDVTEAAKAALAKDGSIFTGTNPGTSAGSDDDGPPGSPSWEQADADCMNQAAQQLLAACALVSQFIAREGQEVAAGETSDYEDVWDAQCAIDAITAALGIVARLSFQEAFEAAKSTDAEVAKAGATHSAKTKAAITSVITTLQNLLASAGGTNTDDDVEKEVIEMTKDELIKLLDERDEARRVAKEEAKAAAKAAKAEQEEAAVKAEADRRAALSPEQIAAEDAAKAEKAEQEQAEKAEQVAATASAVAAKVEEALKGVTEQVATIQADLETVKKMAAPGGPAKTRTPADLEKATERDVVELEIADLTRRADATSDSELRKGYLDRAKEARVRLATL